MWVKGQDKATGFVQGDGWFMIPPDTMKYPIAAFDMLFKLYHVLQVCYPTTLKNFFNFLETYIYRTGTRPLSSVSSLHINISNFNNEDDNGGSNDDES